MTAPLSSFRNRSSEELAMRALCAAKLRELWPTARIIHELPTRYAQNRIDLAAVTETELVALEIKSSRDVADRLEAQLRAFAPVSHLLIVALAPKWNEDLPWREVVRTLEGRRYVGSQPQYTAAQAAIQRVGPGGVWTWTVDAEVGTLTCGYKPVHSSQPWPRRMLDILHRDELVAIASAHRIAEPNRRTTHFNLAEACAELMNGREVDRAVCAALRARAAFARESDAPAIAEASLEAAEAVHVA